MDDAMWRKSGNTWAGSDGDVLHLLQVWLHRSLVCAHRRGCTDPQSVAGRSTAERITVQKRILNEIKGRMLEDIVLLETKLANPKKQVFVHNLIW